MGFDSDLNFGWDDEKSALLKERRGLSLDRVGRALLVDGIMFYGDPRYPEQIRYVGKVGQHFYTLVTEEVSDGYGDYTHAITYWRSEPWEIKAVLNLNGPRDP